MNFQVPQFIETEDKIIGPLTLKQFLYVGIDGGLCFLFFFLLNTIPWIFLSFILTIIALSFAFIKINGQTLMTVFLAALNFYWKPRFYLWQRKAEIKKEPEIKTFKEKISAVSIKSRLDNLWEQLKTSKNPLPKREKAIKPSILEQVKTDKEKFEMMRKITGEKELARRVDYR